MNISLRFQDSISPLIEQLSFFHNYSIRILTFIVCVVIYHLVRSYINFNINSNFQELHQLEIFWTIAPSLLLVILGVPSIKILYLLDEVYEPIITIKTKGFQWYWTYEYSDWANKQIRSFITTHSSPNTRLLNTDNLLVLPIKTQIRNLITANDVLHSWSVPKLGIKIDAIPGRLNQLNFNIKYGGLFFGQCSEICGANHSFMPIALEIIPHQYFFNWITTILWGGWSISIDLLNLNMRVTSPIKL